MFKKAVRSTSSLRKGELTRQAIIDTAHDMASELGLEGLTIGTVALKMRLSKSGVFAHFGSREDLILAVIEEGARRVADDVFVPAIREPRGLPRLNAIVRRWIARLENMSCGCIFFSGAGEYDDRPGPIRDAIFQQLANARAAIVRAVRQAIDEQHLASDTDAEQLAFEIDGLLLAAHFDFRLFRLKGAPARALTAYERLIQSYCAK